MEAYQEQYIANTREIALLSDFSGKAGAGFDAWYASRLEADRRIRELRRDNIRLLNESLFPLLDGLLSASPETISSLESFADLLMDWKTNLDCGLYTVIHRALLSMQRIRGDRGGIIRELYKLGMGYYYLNMYVSPIECPETDALLFRNEMLFTEAASYFRFFEEIEDGETRGYIIRAMANIALCTRDKRKKIATGMRILQIVQDPHYRSMAPGLPWDVFLSRTHQQMSANRNELSAGNLTREELAAVLDSCYTVFSAQQAEARPSIRWRWPYYEMEYSCGYTDAETTMERLEQLMSEVPENEFDTSALYGAVQLPLYYSHMLRDVPRLARDPRRLRFMAEASRKMLEALMRCPPDHFDTYFFFLIRDVLSEYVEFPGCVSYLDLSRRLLQRFSGPLYLRSRKAGLMMRILCGAMLDSDPDCFDDVPGIREIADPERKKAALLECAEGCGLYHAFGLLKMNMSRTLRTRELFDHETEIYRLHSFAGWEDLRSRPSTERYADTSLGHHAWYNGAGGYPENYQRNRSATRRLTDAAALSSWMLDHADLPMEELQARIRSLEGTRFSPLATAMLSNPAVSSALERILKDDGRVYYEEIWRELAGQGS